MELKQLFTFFKACCSIATCDQCYKKFYSHHDVIGCSGTGSASILAYFIRTKKFYKIVHHSNLEVYPQLNRMLGRCNKLFFAKHSEIIYLYNRILFSIPVKQEVNGTSPFSIPWSRVLTIEIIVYT